MWKSSFARSWRRVHRSPPTVDDAARRAGALEVSEVAALAALALTLAVTIGRPRRPPDWIVASVAAGALLLTGVLTGPAARAELRGLGPTIGFLAALLLLGEGCRRAGLFEAIGATMATGARGSARRLLAIVFIAAAAITAVLSLDATVVLLTPIVLVTCARLRADARAPLYACAHLANSGSLLLPVSNLTNLLAFHATRLSFARFAELMVLPWIVALAIEWLVLSRAIAGSGTALAPPPAPDGGDDDAAAEAVPLPRFPLAVLALTLAGFGLSSAVSIAPVWIAAVGAAVMLLAHPGRPAELVRAVQPGFLVVVLALGLIVRAAGDHGLSHAVAHLLPGGSSLPALLAVAGLSAVFANIVNNLPATLILIPLLSGPGPVLAMLIGVGVGPNLTYVGSLATLLWRRVLHANDRGVALGEFTLLGALSAVPILAGASVALWLALRVT